MTELRTVTEPDSSSADAERSTRYDPTAVERAWRDRWLAERLFHAEPDPEREPYTIAIPPPNVTGALHMGHALNGSVQDALIRFKRMQGFNALWIPGIDHAGIATQNVVEKELRKEGLSRHDLGREKFLERVREWKEEYGGTIIQQYKRMGAALDYERERFTMDEGYARAVLETFVSLYEKGYVYRDHYLVNWCGDCRTAISDLEVRQVELTDEMVKVAYPLVDAEGEIVVATVRPETIFADVAVAVNPDDERYASLVGKRVRVPMTDREVPVIADAHVDPHFGTGVLKITPGHDQNDFEIGRRHGLPEPSAVAPDLTMTEIAGRWAGRPVAEARTGVLDDLEAEGLLREREPYRHSVPHCDRSGTRIEPLISLQWFADMRELAKPAIAAVESGDVRFVPASAAKIFMGWMTELKPWCLSRQLWWGHQLPVWYRKDDPSQVHVSLDGPPAAEADQWEQDQDVLDTWFSSGLWPYATLGWPEQTSDLAYFYPTAVLTTAREIINLWVARMMMFGQEFVGAMPFRDVYVHSIVQAPDGRRMSKSLGTGINPLEVMDEYGADATRYGLLAISSSQDVRFNEGKIREGRDLTTKLWNASRLVAMMGDGQALSLAGGNAPGQAPPADVDRLEDRWILSRLARLVTDAEGMLDGYDFAGLTRRLYSFVWNEWCDWYLEAVKPRLRESDDATRAQATHVSGFVLDTVLRLLHPVMPHLTEEIAAQTWPSRGGFLLQMSWPSATDFARLLDPQADEQFEQVRETVAQIRSLRSAAGARPGETLRVQVDAPAESPLLALREAVQVLARVEYGEPGEGTAIFVPSRAGTVALFGLDAPALRERLTAELASSEAEIKRANGKLANERFVQRAPDELVAAEREKVQAHGERVLQLQQLLEQLSA